MLTFITVIHLFVALMIILFVLIQDSKGGAMGILGGGGGSNTLFGSTGAGNFLVKVTTWLAIIFASTCIYLAWASNNRMTSVLDDYVPAAGASAPAVPTEEKAATESGTQEKTTKPAEKSEETK